MKKIITLLTVAVLLTGCVTLEERQKFWSDLTYNPRLKDYNVTTVVGGGTVYVIKCDKKYNSCGVSGGY